MNQHDAPIGSGVDGTGDLVAGAEATSVSKQTTETLMAGERIMEALELADNEIAAFREYEEAQAKGGLAGQVAPPPRNPVLAAYDLEPEEYVLRVIERIPGTALYDALLVLPFGKVVSLMRYLNAFAQKVRGPRASARAFWRAKRRDEIDTGHMHTGMEFDLDVPHDLLPPQDAPPPDRLEPHHAHRAHPAAQESARRASEAKGHDQL